MSFHFSSVETSLNPPSNAVRRGCSASWGSQVAALVLGLSCAVSAHAGLFDDEEARKAIVELRTRIEANRVTADQASARLAAGAEEASKRAADDRKQSLEDTSALKRSLLELSNQMEQLRSELSKQRGQLEQLAKDLADAQKRQREQSLALDERLKKLEPSKVSVDGRDFFVDSGERKEFEQALALFRRGEFGAAQAGFMELLKRFPNTGYAPSALFWLGNAQYAAKEFKEAVQSFRDMMKRMPEHPRTAEAMLSLANSQIELKDVRAARGTLTDLIAQHPQSEAAAAGRDRLSRLK